jgi:uncharacterized protein (DUF427 family)
VARATWKGKVIAESDEFEVVEGNVYFPRSAVNDAHVEASEHTSVCGWKGTAEYLDIVVDGERNENAAWFYATPKDAAAKIEGHVAFWRGVTVER